MISVVLPTYNGARYLRESIESVLRQTVEDWELIVVDDCSTDDSRAIAEAYAAKDARIRVLHNEKNSKLPHSLNVGFHEARGEYLTWTSDDNRYLPQALEKMRDYLDVHPEVSFVSARAFTIDERGERLYTEDLPEGMLPPLDVSSMFLNDSAGACFMYRRDIIQDIGEYDETLFGTEDYDYWLRILEHGKQMAAMPEVLYEYRYHSQSLTMSQQDLVQACLMKLRKKHWPFILEDMRQKPQQLIQIFLEMSMREAFAEKDREAAFEAAPWLRRLHPFDADAKYLVYGAGEYGQRFVAEHSQAVCCFADRNAAFWGTDIDGVPVLSLREAKEKFPTAQVIVAGAVCYAYSMMQSLCRQDVEAFCYCKPLCW